MLMEDVLIAVVAGCGAFISYLCGHYRGRVEEYDRLTSED